MNDITGETPASFEPTIDYVVTKVPRWAFEKLPGAAPVLGTMMQSVGEVMAIGRTFPESLQKALRSLETGRARAQLRPGRARATTRIDRRRARARRGRRRRPSGCSSSRPRCAAVVSVERLHEATGIDPWFLDQILADRRGRATGSRERRPRRPRRARDWRRAKRLGFADAQLAYLWGSPTSTTCARRGSRPACAVTYKTVDTCAAEFAAYTPYHYGTYEDEDEVAPLDAARGRDPRQRPEPHRPGRRVRLLLRARRVRALRRRLRDRDGQLQPRDRLHRLRHQRPPLLRAAHRRGRAATSATRCSAATGERARGRDRRASAGRRR